MSSILEQLPSPSPTTLLDYASASPSDAVASAVSTVVSAAVSALAAAEGSLNETSPIVTDPDLVPEGNYVLNTLMGLFIILVSSIVNALGLNLTKLDHMQQQSVPKRERKKEYMRGLWLAGMGLYIASQVFGSPLALRYLRPDWVAPLGASSLVFNFMFANWLCGTPVTTSDIRGTLLIILGVILIVVFSSINHGLKQELSITELNYLWSRGSWWTYFIFLIAFTAGAYIVANLLAKVERSRASYSPMPSPEIGILPTSRPKPVNAVKKFYMNVKFRWNKWESVVLGHLERALARTDDDRVAWYQGIGWAVAGGSLAGLCLVFTKAVVKVFWRPGHPLVHPSPLFTLILLVATAVLQIICLNKALSCADTVVVVPLFYAGYTVFGFINSLIFYDQTGQYATWVLVAVVLSIGVLIGGVVLLSTKPASDPASSTAPTTGAASQDPAVRLRPQSQVATAAASAAAGAAVGAAAADADGEGKPADQPRHDPGEENVLWEVGSASDDGEEEEYKGMGVGGIQSRGERGGLLLVHDDEDEEDTAKDAWRR